MEGSKGGEVGGEASRGLGLGVGSEVGCVYTASCVREMTRLSFVWEEDRIVAQCV